MAETAVGRLERWADYGAVWRLVEVSDDRAVVQLCTCYGEPVERFESADPELIAYVRTRSRSDED